MKTLRYVPSGVCAKEIEIEIDQDVVKKVKFFGGCSGNREGIARLVEGMPVSEVITRLKGISCQNQTSCPDQLAEALAKMTGK